MTTPNHEQTYKLTSLKNIVHIYRLNLIKKLCKKHFVNGSYADFGCSNGFITKQLIDQHGFKKAYGFDYVPELINEGSIKFGIPLQHLNLNNGIAPGKFDNVSCFETLEHTGDINNSVKTILDSLDNGGRAIISVPIEIGVIGIIKFIVKVLVYKYDLKELSDKKITWPYIKSLLKYERLSQYRDKRESWGNHFGFDYRDVDDALKKYNASYSFKIKGTTAFYLVSK